jgi:hypothetical protein
MISFATKLHILLIMMVIGIGLYMFLLYKEVKMFSEDIDILREEIAALKGPVGASCPLSAPAPLHVPAPLRPEPVVIVEDDEDQEDDDDDDASVTSNEIKNILTNIREKEPEEEKEQEQEQEQEDEEGEEEEQVLKPVANTANLSVANTPNLSLLTVQELQKCKYDELRLYLRDNGVNMTKGTKLELIQKIHGLRKQ